MPSLSVHCDLLETDPFLFWRSGLNTGSGQGGQGVLWLGRERGGEDGNLSRKWHEQEGARGSYRASPSGMKNGVFIRSDFLICFQKAAF